MRARIKKRKFEHTKKKGPIIITVICLLLLTVFASCILLLPHIKLKGYSDIKLNIHTIYQEPGYEASYLGKNLTKQVTVKNTIQKDKLGTYKVIYTLKKGPFKTTATRKVTITDLEKPKIILTGSKETYVCPNQTYQEEGYLATDNYDGDITKKVVIKQEKDKIYYEVKDKHNNQTKVIRNLTYKDITPPELNLQGEEVQFVFVQNAYQEQGYLASDNCDGDLTQQVTVTGQVDTTTIGQYELTYEIKDKEGNTTKKIRTVKVIEKAAPGTIYLTFDDGPRQGTTNVILDILKEEGIKATFFVTNNGPDELIKREAQEGHSIGLHTASHNYAIVYASVDSYFQDLQIVHDRVQRLTGIDSRIIRFPGGSSNTISRKYQQGIMSTLTTEVINRGYQYYDWNLSSGDAGEYTTSEAIYQNVIHHLSKDRPNMILMHDIKPYTRDALKQIIEYAKANNYQFEAITTNTKMVRQHVNN